MTKTLKDLFELYKPKVKGEQRFVDKHVVVKHKDKNGNGDDVFQATNIKSVDKSPEHGYNAGEDEAVYEQVLDETLSKRVSISKKEHDTLLAKHNHARGPGKERNYAGAEHIRLGTHGRIVQTYSHADYGIPTIEREEHDKDGKQKHFKYVKESVEQIDELSKKTLANYITKSAKDMGSRRAAAARTASVEGKRYTLKKAGKRLAGVNKAALKLANEDLQELNRNGALTHYISKTTDDPKRKTGRALALKKRWGDEKYGLPEPKVKAVTRESVEQIDELSKKTLGSYLLKSSASRADAAHGAGVNTTNLAHAKTDFARKHLDDFANSQMKKELKRTKGIHNAVKRLAKEDVDLQELSKKTLASYINKAAVKNLAHAGSLATQAHDEDKDKRDEAGKTAKKLVNKLDGIHRATKRLAKD